MLTHSQEFHANICRMISPNSLSAFSAAVLNGPSAVPPAAGVQKVAANRAPGQGTSPARPSGQLVPSQGTPTQASPGQNLPRGSLLDLSV
jgi:hypothetical protein